MSQPAADNTPTNAPAPFDDPDADIIIRSCDGVQFRTYKLLLSLASPIFKDMLVIPQPPPPPPDEIAGENQIDLPVVDVTETSTIVSRLLCFYHPATELRDAFSLPMIADMIEATVKYQMQEAQKAALRHLVKPMFLNKEPLRVYAIACRYKARKEARRAARQVLRRPLLADGLSADLETIDGATLYRLLKYHQRCTQAASRVAFNHTWIKHGYSFFGCEDAEGSTKISADPHGEHKKDTIEVSAHSWWIKFMSTAQAALSTAVDADAIVDRDTLADTAIAASQCGRCPPHVTEDLTRFMDEFKEEIERTVSQIKLDPGF